jgi:hypothetical protein
MILKEVLKMKSLGEEEVKFLSRNAHLLDHKTKVRLGFVTKEVAKETVVEKVKKAVKKK